MRRCSSSSAWSFGYSPVSSLALVATMAPLFLAEVTVKKHVQQIMSKLAVTNRTQAAIVAIKLGLDN